MKLLFLALSCLASALAAELTTAAQQDKITSLPLQSTTSGDFSQFRNENDFDAPLVLWLNGGPGCSSLGGAFAELGPFNAAPPGKNLTANEFSWNTKANVVFLESPAGVGFSDAAEADLTVGDERTAADTLEFVKKFLDRFPKYKGREFWISGESYGGHYVVGATKAIVDYNKGQSSVEDKINIQGFLVGNAWTVAEEDNKGAVEFWHSHALNSDETFDGIMDNCEFASIGPLKSSADASDADACDTFLDASTAEMGNINIYEVYADNCLSQSKNKDAQQLLKLMGNAHVLKSNPTPDYEPCIDNFVESYLNLKEVQKAMHVKEDKVWAQCSDSVRYSYNDLLSSMLPVYEELLKEDGIRMTVFSGDVDGIVPVTGTRRWLKKLGLKVKEAWKPWTDSLGQVGGYVVQYEGLNFVTVRDAGHMVPYTQPQRALDLLESVLSKKNL